MLLTDLKPTFLEWKSAGEFHQTNNFSLADGIMFACPECFIKKGNTLEGVHRIICWQPHINQQTNPKPGRWKFIGTGYNDLTLEAGSSSIKINGECNAHFFIRNGEIVMAI